MLNDAILSSGFENSYSEKSFSASDTMSQTCEHGAEQLNRIITISYVSIQICIALLISIIGAVHVKRCQNEPKESIRMAQVITLNTGNWFYVPA